MCGKICGGGTVSVRRGAPENPVIKRIRADLYNDPRLSNTYREIMMDIVMRGIGRV